MLKKVVPWMGLSGLALMTACGGGSVNPPQGTQPTSQTASVVFSVIVPQASSSSASARKRPNFTAPTNTQSVSITLKSVYGTAYSSTPSVFNISSTALGCTAGSSQITCKFTMQVPAGSDDFFIQTFTQTGAQGAAEAQATVTANVLAGSTTPVDTTLSGNIASVAISVDSAPLGAEVKVPVVVQAKDANGNTIIGPYTTPIVLADSDSTHTALSTTTLPDSTTAAGVTLNYDGGALSSATISATVSGLSSSAITNGTFTPNSSTYPTMNNSTGTFGVTSWSQENSQTWPGPTTAPSPLPTSTYAATTVTQTGQTFQGVTGLVSMQTDSANFPMYYSWAQVGNAWSLGLVGYNDGTGTYLCSAPYRQAVIVPIPSSSWDALANSGSCSYTKGTETYVFNADGSYSDTTTNTNGDGTVDTYVTAVNSDGSASITVNSQDQGSSIQTLSKPTSNSPTVTVSTQTFPAAIPSPGATTTPAPTVTTAPNFYLAAGITNGVPPSPLESDKFTPKGTVTLPASCAVPSSIVGTSASITEVNEAQSIVDPLQDWNPFFTSDAVQHFYLNGVGEICTIDVNNSVLLDNGGQQWFTTDKIYQTLQTTTETYLTTTSVQAAFARTGSFKSALPAAAMSLTMTNKQMAIRRVMLQRSEHRSKAFFSKMHRLSVTGHDV